MFECVCFGCRVSLSLDCFVPGFVVLVSARFSDFLFEEGRIYTHIQPYSKVLAQH